MDKDDNLQSSDLFLFHIKLMAIEIELELEGAHANER